VIVRGKVARPASYRIWFFGLCLKVELSQIEHSSTVKKEVKKRGRKKQKLIFED
jgi:hypothetical protein